MTLQWKNSSQKRRRAELPTFSLVCSAPVINTQFSRWPTSKKRSSINEESHHLRIFITKCATANSTCVWNMHCEFFKLVRVVKPPGHTRVSVLFPDFDAVFCQFFLSFLLIPRQTPPSKPPPHLSTSNPISLACKLSLSKQLSMTLLTVSAGTLKDSAGVTSATGAGSAGWNACHSLCLHGT